MVNVMGVSLGRVKVSNHHKLDSMNMRPLNVENFSSKRASIFLNGLLIYKKLNEYS